MGIVQTLLATIVTLGLLVTIHEWGHFWVARRCGVRVLRFSVGFGKPLWLRRGRDGTEYAVAMIPLGGYVRMLDEREGEVPEALRHQAFNNKPVLQRMAIVAAGPVVNLLFAVFAYWFLFVWGVTSVVPVVGAVTPNSLAERAGLPVGVELLEVDGHDVQSWDEINLRLASRVGESGSLQLLAGEPGRGLAQDYRVQLDRWTVDLEKESPISALGIQPYRPEVPAVIGSLTEGGVAQAAGLKEGDRIVSIDGQPVGDWVELVEMIRRSPQRTLAFELQRGTDSLEVVITPAERVDDNGERYGFIGAGVQAVEWPDEMLRELRYGPVEAVWIGLSKTGQMIGLTFDAIGKMVVGAISVKNLSGPITIAKVAGASAASGLESFVSFLAYLSISLGVLNLLPIPMLDGGHLMYQLIELVRGRPVSEKVQMLGLRLGMAMLLSLMALAILNDIARL